ncbi:hypothetical protein GPROT1_03610, partial [Gammaproteobacteria bacterium]
NLLGNAVKFTSVGRVLIEVSAQSPVKGRALVKVAVQDTGIGIAQEKLSLLFKSFSQADASTTRHFGGTGLGLAISRQIVELMGGHIGVESKPGEGSTFHFEIDVPLGEIMEQDSAEGLLPQDMRVLVVDDDEVSRQVLSHLCTRMGMKCDTAESGFAALSMLRTAAQNGAPYSLALLDMRMPLMDGAQLARTIKKDERLQATRLAIVSAHVRPDDCTLPVGMVEAVLTKPVRGNVLLPVLKRMFRREFKATTTTTRIKPRPQTNDLPVSGKRVLVAEDNAVNQKLAARMLEKMGCKIDVAANGLEAVGMAMNMNYDLVLMDCQMPEMDGYEATQEIRRRMG